MVETLGSPGDLARAFMRVTTGQVLPEAPMLDPPEPEPAVAVRTAPEGSGSGVSTTGASGTA